MRLQKHFGLIVVPLSAINQWKRSPCFSFFRTKQLFFRLLLALIHLMIDEGVSLSIDISISLKTHICRIHQNCIEISKWVNMLWAVQSEQLNGIKSISSEYIYCTFNVESTANPFLEGYAIWSKVTVTFLHIFLGKGSVTF